jgi:hypothetical protein
LNYFLRKKEKENLQEKIEKRKANFFFWNLRNKTTREKK